LVSFCNSFDRLQKVAFRVWRCDLKARSFSIQNSSDNAVHLSGMKNMVIGVTQQGVEVLASNWYPFVCSVKSALAMPQNFTAANVTRQLQKLALF